MRVGWTPVAFRQEVRAIGDIPDGITEKDPVQRKVRAAPGGLSAEPAIKADRADIGETPESLVPSGTIVRIRRSVAGCEFLASRSLEKIIGAGGSSRRRVA